MKYTDDYWKDIDRVIECIPHIKRLFEKKILITGATGMICSSVTEVLFRLNETRNADIEIYLAGRDQGKMRNRFSALGIINKYNFVDYDATTNRLVDVNVDYIIHGASNANPQIYTKEPVETMLSNIVGLNNLLKTAIFCKADRVLFISSSEVYGNKHEEYAFRETDYKFVDILNPRACYPSAKRAAETLCVSYEDEYNVDTVIVRPGHIYGPTIRRIDSRASAQFTWNVIDGKDILLKSDGAQIRSYCYTLDCASAILAVLINGEKGNAYNIANKHSNVSIRDMAELLAKYSGKKIHFENPSDAEKRGYNLMPNSALDSEKIEALGWKACFNLEDGVQRTIKFLKEDCHDSTK